MRASLVPIAGGDAIALNRDITVVGRKQKLCDLCFEKSSVSKLHCVIVKTDGLLFIRDLGSTNGTKVNGQRISRGALLPGDELAFASLRFRVEMGPGEPDVQQDAETEMLTHLPYRQSGESMEFVGIDEQQEEGSSVSDVRLLDDD